MAFPSECSMAVSFRWWCEPDYTFCVTQTNVRPSRPSKGRPPRRDPLYRPDLPRGISIEIVRPGTFTAGHYGSPGPELTPWCRLLSLDSNYPAILMLLFQSRHEGHK